MLSDAHMTCAHATLLSHSIFVTLRGIGPALILRKLAFPLDVTKIPSEKQHHQHVIFTPALDHQATGLTTGARRKIGPRLARRTAREAPPDFRSSNAQSCAACNTMRGNGRRPRPPHQVLQRQTFAQNSSRCCPPTCSISHAQRINEPQIGWRGGGRQEEEEAAARGGGCTCIVAGDRAS